MKLAQTIIDKVFLPQSWDAYFRNAQANSPAKEADERRPSALLHGRAMSQTPTMSQKVVEDHLAVYNLIRAYQVLNTKPFINEQDCRDELFSVRRVCMFFP